MSFIDSILDGKIGESIVVDFLNSQEKVKEVIDVRDDVNHQLMDIDYYIRDSKNQLTPIEIKTNFQASGTGNIAYELRTSGNAGCFEKTKAKYVYYYLPQITTFYVIVVEYIREYIRIKKPQLHNMGDNAEGYLLDINNLIDSKVIIKTVNIKEWYENEYKSRKKDNNKH